METETGFASHPLSNLYFFECSIPVDELNHGKIFLRFTNNGKSYEGIFEMSAWSSPTLPQFIAISARAYDYNGPQCTYHAIKFDSGRASAIRRVHHDNYRFEADLGKLQPLQQVPTVYKAVCKEFEKRIEQLNSGG